MRLIDMHREKKSREAAARYWAGRAGRQNPGSRSRLRSELFRRVNLDLAAIAELDIQSALAQPQD